MVGVEVPVLSEVPELRESSQAGSYPMTGAKGCKGQGSAGLRGRRIVARDPRRGCQPSSLVSA